jgi:glucose/arabinose dehydrogenase
VHGLAIRDGRLYMVTVNELYSAPIQEDGGLGERTQHIDDIPDGGQHPNRTMKWGPDGMLYLSVGSQTNGVPEPDEETATMMRVNPENWEREIFAEGLRNTIGFGWHPVSGNFYGLDHNTDHRGNNWPPEEVNRSRRGGTTAGRSAAATARWTGTWRRTRTATRMRAPAFCARPSRRC